MEEKIINIKDLEACQFWCADLILTNLKHEVKGIIRPSYNNAEEKYQASISVCAYENGREHGYTFSIRYKHWQKNYSVFCPCQYDAICVQPFEQYSDTPYPWVELEWNKYNPSEEQYDESYKGAGEAAEFIANDMYESLHNVIIREGKGEKIDSKTYNIVIDEEKEKRYQLYLELKKEFENS